MRSYIAFALLCSMAFATTIKEDCKPNCMTDCMKVEMRIRKAPTAPWSLAMGPMGWVGMGRMTMAVTNWVVPCQS